MARALYAKLFVAHWRSARRVLGKVLGAMIGLGVALLVTHTAWVILLLSAVGFFVGLRLDLQHAEVIERARVDDGAPMDVPRRPSAPARPAEPDTLELLVDLLVAISQVDGDVSREEIRSIRRLLESEPWRRRVPSDDLAERLKKAIARPAPVGAAARLAKGVIPYAERVTFLEALYALAHADGELKRPERIALDRVAKLFEISEAEAQEVATAYTAPAPPPPPSRPRPDENAVSYQILGLAVDASDSDLKKAYRKLAREHHPDRVAHLGKAAVESASARFREIDQAYETIRKARGL